MIIPILRRTNFIQHSPPVPPGAPLSSWCPYSVCIQEIEIHVRNVGLLKHHPTPQKNKKKEKGWDLTHREGTFWSLKNGLNPLRDRNKMWILLIWCCLFKDKTGTAADPVNYWPNKMISSKSTNVNFMVVLKSLGWNNVLNFVLNQTV